MIIENFDARFSDYIGAWMRESGHRYQNADAMEAAMPEVYTRWLNAPADWLGGVSPGMYFASYEDAALLIDWMRGYLDAGVPIPDPLLERVAQLGDSAYPLLVALLRDEEGGELVMLALSLLCEIDAQPPIGEYIALVRRHDGRGEIAIRAAEALRSAGVAALRDCLEAMQGASFSVRLCLMDVLADFPGERAVIDYARALLRERRETALAAAYIARLGDDGALEDLYAAAADPACDYLAYTEIAGAIESLGGDPPDERAFDGDPSYESLRNM